MGWTARPIRSATWPTTTAGSIWPSWCARGSRRGPRAGGGRGGGAGGPPGGVGAGGGGAGGGGGGAGGGPLVAVRWRARRVGAGAGRRVHALRRPPRLHL